MTHLKQGDKPQTIEKMAILVECSDGKVRQVLTSKEDTDYIQSLLVQLHKGKIQVIETVFDNVIL